MRNPFGKKSPAAIELPIPAHFRCPISLELMKDPVTLPTGITYDRPSIEAWLETGNRTCPVTKQATNGNEELVPNHSIRRMIQDWCVANRSHGIERIPTPKIPVSPSQVFEMLSEIDSASQQTDAARCRGLVAKMKTVGKESERNRQCILSAGASRALCVSFNSFASGLLKGSSNGVLEEILSAILTFLPLDGEACRYLRSRDSLKSILLILETGNLGGRLNAISVLKELVAKDKDHIDAVVETEGMIEAMVKLIKEPISPKATKASLVAIFYLVSSNARTASRFVELGMVSMLLELVVDSEKSTCEKALAVLDGMFSCESGREDACDHALTAPVLAKKMFRVSDLATEFAVSAMWKLCKNAKQEDGRGEEIVVQALQAGAFQKLLLLLQLGCSEATKEKVTDLLKLLNGKRETLECIETVDRVYSRR